MSQILRRTLAVAGLMLLLQSPSPGRAETSAAPERPVVIDPNPDWSSRWANRVCSFARALAAYDESFTGGAQAICGFVLGTE